MTYTAPATVATAGTSAAAQFNAALRDDVAAMASRASMSYQSAGGFTMPASTTAKAPAMATDWDSPDGMVDLVNQRIVIQQAGKYRILAGSGYAGGTAWTLFVRKNGAGTLVSQNGLGIGFNFELDWAASLLVGDYLELWYTNPAGAPLVIFQENPYVGIDGTFFVLRAEWVAP